MSPQGSPILQQYQLPRKSYPWETETPQETPIHGTFGCVFNIKIILFRFYLIHKHNLNLILDDHVKKEIRETPGPDRMSKEAEKEFLANYLTYSMKEGFPMTRAMVRKFVINITSIKEDPRRSTVFNLEKGDE